MTYIMSCVWLDYMVKYFQCKNCVGSSLKTKKCVASFLVPGDIKRKGVLDFQVRLCTLSGDTLNSVNSYLTKKYILCILIKNIEKRRGPMRNISC